MAEQVLFCARYSIKFRAKSSGPRKTYQCPKCSQALQVSSPRAKTAVEGALNTQGDPVSGGEAGSLCRSTTDGLTGKQVAQHRPWAITATDAATTGTRGNTREHAGTRGNTLPTPSAHGPAGRQGCLPHGPLPHTSLETER